MFTFCDVLHEGKQKVKRTLKSTQYELEIVLKELVILKTV